LVCCSSNLGFTKLLIQCQITKVEFASSFKRVAALIISIAFATGTLKLLKIKVGIVGNQAEI
jgi:hypothetical protein